MDKIPATVEDVVASLAPGLVLLLGLAWIYPIPLIQQFAVDGSKMFVLLIVGYALGHLLRGAALAITWWAEILVLNAAWDKFEGKAELDRQLALVHGAAPKTAKGREGLCLGMLPQVMPRREGFLVSSSFCSSAVVLSIALPAVEVSRHGLDRIGWGGVAIASACVVVFFVRYWKLRTYSAFEVFNSIVPTIKEIGAAPKRAS